MEYWNELITEKSWEILKDLIRKKEFNFIVIGGWATYLLTKRTKSKDINIILNNLESLQILKTKYELKKNVHLKKYEIKIEGVDIDIYIPFYSELGIPCEEILKERIVVDGIPTISPEMLVILKQMAEKARTHSLKGKKDRIDIISILLLPEFNFKKYQELLSKYNLELKDHLQNLIKISDDEFRFLFKNLGEIKKLKKHLLTELK